MKKRIVGFEDKGEIFQTREHHCEMIENWEKKRHKN